MALSRRALPAAVLAAQAALSVVVVAGCRATTAESTTPTVRVSAPPATSWQRSDEAADRRAVEAAYRRFWLVTWTVDRDHPAADWRTVVATVAVDPELGLVVSGTRQLRLSGLTLYGRPIPHPTVMPVNGGDMARVRDCQDASHSGQADAATGRARTVGVARNLVEAVLVRGADGRWRVSRISYPGGSCS
jgi:hypothetical protein